MCSYAWNWIKIALLVYFVVWPHAKKKIVFVFANGFDFSHFPSMPKTSKHRICSNARMPLFILSFRVIFECINSYIVFGSLRWKKSVLKHDEIVLPLTPFSHSFALLSLWHPPFHSLVFWFRILASFLHFKWLLNHTRGHRTIISMLERKWNCVLCIGSQAHKWEWVEVIYHLVFLPGHKIHSNRTTKTTRE